MVTRRRRRALGRRYGRSASGGGDLSTIRVLFRAPDTLALYGLPYEMRRDIGQAPRHLWKAGQTKGWIWLGSPGWFGSMTAGRRREVEAFLSRHKDDIPGNPYEWVTL